MFRLKDKLLSIPFPDTCILCGDVTDNKSYACNSCRDKVGYINTAFKCRTCLGFLHTSKDGVCGTCLIEKPSYSQLVSCVKYTGEVKERIKGYKFRQRPDYHIGFSRLACEILEREGVYFDAVVPMPLSKKSFKERGYNQSALIAKKIAEVFEVPYYDNVLIKVKETQRQSELKLNERKKNIQGAFKIRRSNLINGKTVLLVDDIYTSGCTMREAAKICSPYTEDIVAFTIARTQFKY